MATGDAGRPGVPNTANATADDGGTGSATDTVAITTHANVADVKVDSPDRLSPATTDLHDHGDQRRPVGCPEPTVNDTLDAQLTGATYCVDSGTGCVPGGAWTGSVNLGTLEPGDSVDVVITATVAPSTTKATC